MGATSSKKKNKKSGEGGFGILGDLADAAEGATSSLTKAIEDTSAAVNSKIETTTKSVTEAIDNTTKNLTGTADKVTADANKSANSAVGGLSATLNQLQETAEQTSQQLSDAAKKGIDDASKAVNTTSEAVKGELEAAEKNVQQTTADITKGVQDSADKTSKVAKDTYDQAVSKVQTTSQTVSSNIQKSTEEAKKTVDSKVGELKTSAQEKGEQVKGSIETASEKAKATGDTWKNNLSDLSDQGSAALKELERSGKETGKQLESQVEETRKKGEAKLSELKSSAEAKSTELKEASDAKAKELKEAAESKAAALKETAEGRAAALKESAEGRAAALKGTAEGKAAEFKGQAEALSGEISSKTVELKKSTSDAQSSVAEARKSFVSETEGLKGNLTDLTTNTGNLMKGTAEGLKTAVSGAVETAVITASTAAQKTVEGVSSSLTKASGDVSKGLTGAISQVSGSVTSAAGTAVAGLVGKAGLLGTSLAEGTSNFTKMAESTLGKAAEAVGAVPACSMTVCGVDDLKEGEMKVFKVSDEGNVLLVKENGVFSAIGTKCSHYGAPLSKGVLLNGTVRCPWHGACFNVKTGDIEDSPGLDSLPCYKVTVEEDQVKVWAPLDLLKHNMRTKDLCSLHEGDGRTFVIIGGGGAAESCAETLRQEGFKGKLVVLTKENDIPYDRPKLSKALSSTGKDLALRSAEYFKNGDIEFFLEHEVTSVDVENKEVLCANDAKFCYDMLMIATGGTPIIHDVPGKELINICYLRTPADANRIAEVARDKNAVVIGTSFIGMEVASYLHGKAKSVSVIGRSKTPFAQVFGEEVGERLKKMCQEKGIIFHVETEVSEFIGTDGKLTAVKLKNGEEIAAEVCVVGIGCKPATQFLKGGNVPLTAKGFIPVDKNMKTSVEGIFAAGDIVEFPLPLFQKEKATIGHWQMAQMQGRQAAHSMLQKDKEFHTVPFFWCSLFGKSVRYAGYGEAVEEYIIDGDVEAMKFVLYACCGDRVVAVATMASDPVASHFASFTCSGRTLNKSEIQADPKAWIRLCG